MVIRQRHKILVQVYTEVNEILYHTGFRKQRSRREPCLCPRHCFRCAANKWDKSRHSTNLVCFSARLDHIVVRRLVETSLPRSHGSSTTGGNQPILITWEFDNWRKPAFFVTWQPKGVKVSQSNSFIRSGSV